MNEEGREFRLRPRKPRVSRSPSDHIVLSSGFKMLMHYVRQSRGTPGNGSSGGKRSFPHRQRCAVRITYTRNTTRGQWRAHGRYLERESAAGRQAGFSANETSVDVSTRLQEWQAGKDELFWKFIISPEFGDRADLQRLTRDVMRQVEADLSRPLQWVAVVHRNTEHPHAHVALRGIAGDGKTLRLSRDFVKRGVREVAEEFCTRQMGFRTTLDAAEAERREIGEMRFTSLDRTILRHAQTGEKGLTFGAASGKPHVTARLAVLSRIGLAGKSESGWVLRSDVEQVLRAMQRSRDRQKTLFVQGEPISDKRLAIEVVDWGRTSSIEGRVLMHGEDEQSGRRFLMLEATSARVLHIDYTPEMDAMRSRGELKTSSFVRFRKLSASDRLRIGIEDLGSAEAVLSNRRLLREKVGELRGAGLEPTEDGWGGWLGRFQKALCEAEREKAPGQSDQKAAKEKSRSSRSMER